MRTIRKYLAMVVSLGLCGCVTELATPLGKVKSQDSDTPAAALFWAQKDPNVIVVDSEDHPNWTEQVGTWLSAAGADAGDYTGSTLATWGADYGKGEARFRWRPELPSAGLYRVSVWYGDEPGNGHTPHAPFTVHYDGGKQTHRLDQKKHSCGWKVLGSYRFKAGTAGYVELTNDVRGRVVVVADAVRFERLN